VTVAMLRIGDIVERTPGPSGNPVWRHTITSILAERKLLYTEYEDGLDSPLPSCISELNMQNILVKPGTRVFRGGCMIWPNKADDQVTDEVSSVSEPVQENKEGEQGGRSMTITPRQRFRLEQWAECGLQIQAMTEKLGEVGIAPGSPIFELFWNTHGLLTDVLEDFIGLDPDEIPQVGSELDYFAHECGFGQKPKTVTVNGESVLLDSVERLIWLLESKEEEQ